LPEAVGSSRATVSTAPKKRLKVLPKHKGGKSLESHTHTHKNHKKLNKGNNREKLLDPRIDRERERCVGPTVEPYTQKTQNYLEGNSQRGTKREPNEKGGRGFNIEGKREAVVLECAKFSPRHTAKDGGFFWQCGDLPLFWDLASKDRPFVVLAVMKEYFFPSVCGRGWKT
jgi:hypothetical protein